MPTARRPCFAAESVGMFLAQTWPYCELVILDDMMEPSFREPPQHPRIIYERCRPMPLALKRNMVCGLARGEIFCHWDDDDIQHPDRIKDQVERLLAANAEITGYHSAVFWNVETGQRVRYRGRQGYALGTSFCYRKSYWLRRRFSTAPEPGSNKARATGEDNRFIQGTEVLTVSARDMIVVRIHAGQTQENVRRIAEAMRERAKGEQTQWEPVLA